MNARVNNKKSIKSMSHSDMLLVIVPVIALMGMMSCNTQRRAMTVQEKHMDTVYIAQQQYDSIHIYKDRWLDRSHDTVYMTELSTEYRYKLLRDTVRMVVRDSIPYTVVRTETREVQRPLSWFDKLSGAVFWLVVGAVVIRVASAGRRNKNSSKQTIDPT